MVICEITGKETKNPVKIKVAGTILTVDISQKHMGELIDSKKGQSSHTFTRRIKTQVNEEVVENFQSTINKELARKKLNLHQLARMINIKESTLNKIFSGKIKPDLELARKLERFFEVTLVEEVESSSNDFSLDDVMVDDSSSNSGFTLGDLIKKAGEKKK